MSTLLGIQLGEGGDRDRSLGAADVAPDDHRRVRGAVLQQQRRGPRRPATAGAFERRVVDRDHQVGRGAAAASRAATTSHGLSRSDSEITA